MIDEVIKKEKLKFTFRLKNTLTRSDILLQLNSTKISECLMKKSSQLIVPYLKNAGTLQSLLIKQKIVTEEYLPNSSSVFHLFDLNFSYRVPLHIE